MRILPCGCFPFAVVVRHIASLVRLFHILIGIGLMALVFIKKQYKEYVFPAMFSHTVYQFVPVTDDHLVEG